MLGRFLRRNHQEEEIPQEGDLYARIEHKGHTFELYYGYYEECDRQNPMVRPVPLYPDFVAHPQYDEEGYPFVTEMQDVCRYYIGNPRDDGCYGCEHYHRLLEFVGYCTCPRLRKQEKEE